MHAAAAAGRAAADDAAAIDAAPAAGADATHTGSGGGGGGGVATLLGAPVRLWQTALRAVVQLERQTRPGTFWGGGRGAEGGLSWRRQ